MFKLSISLLLVLISVPSFSAQDDKLPFIFAKACIAINDRLNKQPDPALSEASKACSSSGGQAALELVRRLSKLANAIASSPQQPILNERLVFIAGQLESLREGLIKSKSWPRPKPAMDISKGLRELSGFTVDTKRNFLFGISDETANLVRVNFATMAPEFFLIDGLKTKDTESVLTGPDGKVWVMDVGDNLSVRQSGAVYIFNPDNIKNGHVSIDNYFEIIYPNGRKPNIEASFIYGTWLFLIEKTLYRPAEVFAVSLSSRGNPVPAKSVGFLTAGSPISDAYVDPTTGQLFVLGWFDLREIPNWQRGLNQAPKFLFEDFLGQQEALGFDPKTKSFIIGTEEGTIFLMRTR